MKESFLSIFCNKHFEWYYFIIMASYVYIWWDLDRLGVFFVRVYCQTVKRENPKSLLFLHCSFSCTDPWSSLHPSLWRVEPGWAHIDAEGSTDTVGQIFAKKPFFQNRWKAMKWLRWRRRRCRRVYRKSWDGQKSRKKVWETSLKERRGFL